jgi:hypothetical protein
MRKQSPEARLQVREISSLIYDFTEGSHLPSRTAWPG